MISCIKQQSVIDFSDKTSSLGILQVSSIVHVFCFTVIMWFRVKLNGGYLELNERVKWKIDDKQCSYFHKKISGGD